MTPADRHEELGVLAGEHALGLLDPRETAAFERAMEQDPDLAALVTYWEERLAELALTVDPARPDPALWRRIAITVAQLEGVGGPQQRGAAGRRRRWVGRWWSSLPFWRLSAAVAALAALALAAHPFVLPPGPPEAPGYVAVLRAAQGGEPTWLIQEARDDALLVTPLQPVEVPAGMRLRLWTRLDPAAGVVDLGPVPGGASARLPPTDVPFLAAGQFFGISLEPVTGSPGGTPAPTGAMLHAGRLVEPPRADAPAAADQP